MRAKWLPLLVAAQLWAQPPVKTGLKLANFQAQDPYILADTKSRTYYLYTAADTADTGQNRSGVVAYRSRDLENWEGPHVVFTVPDGLWANPQHGAVAPKVQDYRGKYYLFTTLSNNDAVIAEPPASWRRVTRRGTQILVADSPDGPFKPLGNNPIAPADFSTLDGTLYVEDGIPYMVYAHDWMQLIDGIMEAIPLKSDLSEAAGEPFYLLKGSDAPWWKEQFMVSKHPRHYVTDSPFLYKTRAGKLLMIWSSQKDELAAEALAYSLSGKLQGPWRQSAPLLTDNTGHATIFTSFDGQLMLVAQRPTMNGLSCAKLWELEDTGDTIRIKKER